MNAVYYYGQDGEVVDDKIKKLFELDEKELRWSSSHGTSVYSVVGFVFKENNILVVFPKHYYTNTELSLFNGKNLELTEDIELLYNVIKRYNEKKNITAHAQAYMGAKEDFDSDYPFQPFYEIYGYFQKYGLYKEKSEEIVPNGSGRISWKKTISKANKIISDGNLIFLPLYSKKKNYNSVFVTDCMAFIIDYTIDHFHSFLNLKKTNHSSDRFDYFGNIEYVLMQLKQYSNTVFKDIHKQLLLSMIAFFEQYKDKTKAKGGNIHVKIRYFDMIWQDMMAQYLNKHFVKVDTADNSLIFDTSLTSSSILFSDRTFGDIDDSTHNYSIDVDHLAYNNNILYIFDSKYYFEAKELNYKQYSYNEILRYHFAGTTNIFNALLLPGNDSSLLHFSLSSKYQGSRKTGNTIIEQYLSIKEVMKDYLM